MATGGPGSYSHARGEFVEALFHNGKALDTLQKMYKLPEIYSTINPARTVRALETIGVFSSENPEGLIELPHWLDMKETNKKIKRTLKSKKGTTFRFKGSTELHINLDMKNVLSTVQASGRYFQAEVELLQTILQTRAAQRGNLSAIRVIPLITDLVKEVNDAMNGLRTLANELYNDHESDPLKITELNMAPNTAGQGGAGGSSDPLRRRPMLPAQQPPSPMVPRQQPNPFHPLRHSPVISQPTRVIEREARRQDNERRLAPVILADDNPYQIFPNRRSAEEGGGIRTSQTFDSLSNRQFRADTVPMLQYDDTISPPSIPPIQYDDTVSSSLIPPIQYGNIIQNRPLPAVPPAPELPPRIGQPERQQTTSIRQQNSFQPRPFLTTEQSEFQRHNVQRQSLNERDTTHRRPPPIPAPYNSFLQDPPASSRTDTMSSVSSVGYVDMHSAGSVMLPNSNSSSSVQSTDRYQRLRSSRMEVRDSYMNMGTLNINPPDSGDLRKDPSYVNMNPVIDSLRDEDNDENLVQEEYDTFGTSATNPFYTHR